MTIARWSYLAVTLAGACGGAAPARSAVIEHRRTAGVVRRPLGPARPAVIRGVVRDRRRAPVEGVTVIARAGGRHLAELTDVDGRYQLEADTGAWTLTFYFGDVVVERRPEPAARGWIRVVDQVIDTDLAP
ncbi:MAG: hypothetical protein IPL61_04020 [Myxococcales bacterium]|nr:hypothetical protein [Myxococcales bacterium]